MPGMPLAHLRPLRWLGQRDRGFTALRRATRTAIIMPAMFALGDKVIGDPQVATFAAFGSFAMLLLVDFGGPMAEPLQAQAALGVTGGVASRAIRRFAGATNGATAGLAVAEDDQASAAIAADDKATAAANRWVAGGSAVPGAAG